MCKMTKCKFCNFPTYISASSFMCKALEAQMHFGIERDRDQEDIRRNASFEELPTFLLRQYNICCHVMASGMFKKQCYNIWVCFIFTSCGRRSRTNNINLED